ncbi:S-norcoclaurine synthase 1-like [Asparagus officinalis]|uniref:S-norcoclaurine synthase 1-like n=1 Tax=Asparagus officinalis TaxID=4686 RepID=UPI00098E20E7|nr:S-norcoclaurine synthase 1-like [Asparagus officinalis]
MNPEVCEEERAKLDLACREWGFFQLINHGVLAEVMEKVKEDVANFFKLPLEEKEAFKQLPSGVEGYGNLFVISEEQKLDWKDILVCYTQPQTKRNMRFWPTNPPTFRETVDNYSSALKGVSTSLLGSLSHCLGLESQHLINVFGEQVQAMQFNYYPPCPKANKVLGHSPHSDGTGLTILLQANNVSGLQIKKSGKWFTVEPLPGAFVVNVGDLLEIFSNGRYKSVEHRATINPENARISVAAFHTPACKIIGPLPELLKGGEELYKTTSVDDFERGYFAAKLNGKSHLECMKISK